MNGVHDVDGMDGMGSVRREENEPLFHEEWEQYVFAMLPATMGQEMYNIDEFRHAIERMNPSTYLGSSYYEHWLAAYETLLTEKGIVDRKELASRIEELASNGGFEDLPRREDPEFTEQMIELAYSGASTKRDPVEPKFHPGDRVLVRNIHPEGHTRCSRYVRRAHGVVDHVHGTFVLPDDHAHGRGENPEPVYSVKFEAEELWGENAEPNHTLYIDLWESYLESQ